MRGMIDDNMMSVIHESAVKILSETGMWFESSDAVQMFKEHGFKTDNHLVYFDNRKIDTALKTAPKQFDVIAPNRKYDVHVGGDDFVFSSSASSTRILDIEGNIRATTSHDYENALKILNTLPEIDFMFEYVVPDDHPPEHYLLHNLYTQMSLTEKPLSCQTTDGIGLLSAFYGAAERKMAESALSGLCYGIAFINTISPLGMSGAESERIVKFANAGISLALTPMAMAGMTAPCTLEGLIVQQNAEILAALTLAQLAVPGSPVLYGCSGAITNMRNTSMVAGAPEARVIGNCAARMARFYNIPSRAIVGMTDSNCVDYQAGLETILSFEQSVRNGAHAVTGIGALSGWLIASFEKLVLDADCVSYVKRLLRGLQFSNERLALDVIKSVGARGSFIMEDHTYDHFRTEFFETAAFDRQPFDKYDIDGRRACLENANRRVTDILSNYKKPDIPKSDLKKLYELTKKLSG